MLYGLNDITIVPAVVSDIESRGECNPYIGGSLPLFTAPMSCIISDKNWEIFSRDGEIWTVIPRNIDLGTRLSLCEKTFCAFSLEEFEIYFASVKPSVLVTKYICIDIANGHMKKLLDLCKKAKEIHSNKLVLMAGNIANPETYLEYAKVGIDYVRVGIGSGNACTTSANSGVHYPMASLIQECVKNKEIITYSKNEGLQPGQDYHSIITGRKYNPKDIKSIPKIIADGGFKNFDQIIKALALGADYVMLGEIFAKCEEACSEITETVPFSIRNGYTPYSKEACLRTRAYYGMSTKRAQMELGVTDPEKLKTAEGIEKQVTIDYTLEQWVDNFKHYLRSAMSYCGCRTLKEFSKVRTEVISNQSFNSYYK